MSDDFIVEEDPRARPSARPFLIITTALLSTLIVLSLGVIGLLVFRPGEGPPAIAGQEPTPTPQAGPSLPPTPAPEPSATPPPSATATTPLPPPAAEPTETATAPPRGALVIVGYDDVVIIKGATAEPTQRAGPLRIITYGEQETPDGN